ncbi:toluene efflux pump outer membrane protein TtgF precursor [bacterium BMS3Abin14]|nr:toluene efflux pump outer membrane protein TtgF precursor [bacterium BMS3Abin14]
MRRSLLILLLVLLLPWTVPGTGHALTLQEGLGIVTSRGRRVQIAAANQDAAAEEISLSRSKRLPQVALFARQSLLAYQPEARFGPSGPVPVADKNSLSYGFRASQLLYDFGRSSSSLRAAALRSRAQGFSTETTRNAVARDFIMAYIALLEAEKQLDVAQDEVSRYESHMGEAKAMYEEGLVTVNDLLRAKVVLSDAMQKKVSAQSALSVRASVVNNLLLRPLSAQVKPDEISTATFYPKPDLDLATRTAENLRPELRELQSRIEAKEATVRSLRASSYPTISLNGGFDYEENEYMVHESNWNLTAGVTLNLYSGGRMGAKLRQAEAQLDALRVEREAAVGRVGLEVREAVLGLRSADERLAAAQDGVKQAEENLRLLTLRYEEGESTATGVQDSVTLLARAKTSYWSALYGLQRETALLIFAQGLDLVEAYNHGK